MRCWASLGTSSQYLPVAGSDAERDGRMVCLLPLSFLFSYSFWPDKTPWRLWPWYAPPMVWHHTHSAALKPGGVPAPQLQGSPLFLPEILRIVIDLHTQVTISFKKTSNKKSHLCKEDSLLSLGKSNLWSSESLFYLGVNKRSIIPLGELQILSASVTIWVCGNPRFKQFDSVVKKKKKNRSGRAKRGRICRR